MEDENVYELEQPLAVRIKDEVYEELFLRLNLKKREIYTATKVMFSDGSPEGKRFFKLFGRDEFFDEDYFMLMINVNMN